MRIDATFIQGLVTSSSDLKNQEADLRLDLQRAQYQSVE